MYFGNILYIGMIRYIIIHICIYKPPCSRKVYTCSVCVYLYYIGKYIMATYVHSIQIYIVYTGIYGMY